MSRAFTSRWIVSECAVIQAQSLKVTGRTTSTVCRLYVQVTQAIMQLPTITHGRFPGRIVKARANGNQAIVSKCDVVRGGFQIDQAGTACFAGGRVEARESFLQ